MIDPNKENYLGDGLYASFDGFQIKLRAPTLEGDREVFLESSVLAEFLAWLKKTGLASDILR